MTLAREQKLNDHRLTQPQEKYSMGHKPKSDSVKDIPRTPSDLSQEKVKRSPGDLSRRKKNEKDSHTISASKKVKGYQAILTLEKHTQKATGWFQKGPLL